MGLINFYTRQLYYIEYIQQERHHLEQEVMIIYKYINPTLALISVMGNIICTSYK